VQVPDHAPNACRHNLKYWNRLPTLGLGPSAHSFLAKERWWNHRSLERYCEAIEAGVSPEEGRETLTVEQERLETLSLGLRTRSGLLRLELLSFPGAREQLPRLVREGLLEELQDRVVPTRKGLVVADRLPLLFL
jgi:oxygen-independent coproporphyrinogen-3 oxidase